MNFSSQARTGINILTLVEVEGASIEKIISIVQDNPEFFRVRVGHSCLEAAANKLEQLVKESAQQSVQAATNTCPYCGGTGKGKMNGIEVGCIMCSKTGRRQAAKT